MKFSITRTNLAKGLGAVARLAIGKMPIPILNNILLETEKSGLVLSVTNLELGIQVRLPAKTEGEAKFTVSARLLHEFIQNCGEITIEGQVTNNAFLSLTTDRAEVKIRGFDASEFPGLPFTKETANFHLLAKELKEAIDTVVFASAIDDTRPVLAGILWVANEQELTLAATDSYRLARRKLKIVNQSKNQCSVIVPKFTLLELSRLLADEVGDISVFVGDNQIQFEFGFTKVVSRLIEGAYPEYEAIIPKEYRTRVTANAPEWVASLKMANLFAKEAANTVKHTIVPGRGMNVSSIADQKGEAESRLTAIAEGEELTIIFNIRYLLEALSVIQSDNVFIELSGPERPAVLRPANSKDYLSLVMPLKID